MRHLQSRLILLLLFCLLPGTVIACAAPPSEEAAQVDPTHTATSIGLADTPTPLPTDTAVPATNPPTPEPEIVPTVTPEPTILAEPTAEPEPIIPIGSTANWTETADSIGIEGEIEFLSATQVRIENFVFLAAEAPGVDIRLGVGDDFSDEVAVSLKDITGKTYEGRSLTLTIPAEAFNGRFFDSIGILCYDTGDLFDAAPIVTQ